MKLPTWECLQRGLYDDDNGETEGIAISGPVFTKVRIKIKLPTNKLFYRRKGP